MPSLKPNAQTIKAAKPIAGRRTEYRIEGVRGLVLDSLPSGEAYYRAVYHVRQGGKRKLRKMKLGERSEVTLADARKRALEIAAEVAKGHDPAGQQRAKRDALTVGQLIEQRLGKSRGDKGSDDALGERAREDYRWTYDKYIKSALGNTPAAELTAKQVSDLLDKIASADKLVTADRVRITLGSTFKWAMKRHMLTHNPAAGLGRRSSAQARDRVMTDAELQTVLHATLDSTLGERMKIILQLLILTAQRGGEVCGMRKAELHGLDTDAPVWVIPGDKLVKGRSVRGRTKNGREQRVMLSRQAAALIGRAMQMADHDADHVFASDNRDATGEGLPHIQRHSVSQAMAKLRKRYAINEITPHDARRTAATWMGEAGIRPDVIERVLNHAPRGITRQVYDRSRLEPLVREALQRWADHVAGLMPGTADNASNANVISGPWASV